MSCWCAIVGWVACRDERRKGATQAGKEKQEKRGRHIKQRKDKKIANKIARVSHAILHCACCCALLAEMPCVLSELTLVNHCR